MNGFKGEAQKRRGFLRLRKMSRLITSGKKAVRSSRSYTAFNWEREQLVSPVKSPEAFIELNDELRHLLEALEKCTGDQQLVIILRYFQELSIAETAAILNWTEGKVKTTQHRAIKQLRELLSNKKEANQYES